MTSTITALIIRPGHTPQLTRIPNTLEAKQQIVGGPIEHLTIGQDVSCYVNEEGKTRGLTPNRALRYMEDNQHGHAGDIADIIHGTFLITGNDPTTGRDTSLTPVQACEYEHRFHQPEAPYRTPSGHTGMTPIHETH
ncbi:hypothetical protein COO72_12250 [Bifidobacterium callitrichos]|nr:hypothetical protein COO72_12250 [Bifidobacterium callitrichos]